ncbi:hypothetical protein BH10BAC1_BH10BAC1_12300 [soil metagenome]
MRLPKLLALLLAALASTTLTGQNVSLRTNDSTVCLKVIGLAIEKDIPINGVINELPRLERRGIANLK